jgi:hypothetical protein
MTTTGTRTVNKATCIPSVYIPAHQKHAIFEIARGRNAAKHSSWSRRASEVFSDAELDMLGMLGEVAVASLLGIDYDATITTCGDNGTDMTTHSGLRVAVKFNHRFNGYLMIEGRSGDSDSKLKDLKTDVLILSCSFCDPTHKVCRCRDGLLNEGKGSTVLVPGWIYSDTFMSVRQTTDWGLGLRHYVTVQQLEPICTLMRA